MKRMCLVITLVWFMLEFAFGPAAAQAADPISNVIDRYPAYVYIDDQQKWGYINEGGTFVIKAQYDSAETFNSYGYAVVGYKGRMGLIDISGRYVLQPDYEYVKLVAPDRALVSSDQASYRLVDLKGKVLFATDGRIEDFNDGMAVYAVKKGPSDLDGYLYGYVSISGQVLIKARFEEAGAFHLDKAPVKLPGKGYALINRGGEVVKAIPYDLVLYSSNDVLVYKNSQGLYGYLDNEANIMIEARFSGAEEFIDGAAIVNLSQDYLAPAFGLIDQKGHYILEPQYMSVDYLGESRYEVSRFGYEIGAEFFNKKAVFNRQGQQLTEMDYYLISPYTRGFSSLADDTSTIIIDANGQTIKNMPGLKGTATISLTGTLIKVDLDRELLYLNLEGRTVWKSERSFTLPNGAMIKSQKFHPDLCLLKYYPVISQHPDRMVQDQLNLRFKELLVGDRQVSTKDGDLYTEMVESSYELACIGRLLELVQYDYYYAVGAAHGMPGQVSYHINTDSGRFYTLKDLFKPGTDFSKSLTALINDQIKKQNDEQGMLFVEQVEPITGEQHFMLSREGLKIYYQPYEIAAYAAGFPEFLIPYSDILDIIDVQGELWNLVKPDVILD